MDKKFLLQITTEMQEHEKIYKNRSFLDPSFDLQEIVGREKQATDLMHYLMTFRKNYVVPFISIYGRSGSGKSTLVKFILESFRDEISYVFVNLRNAKSIFGSVNLILGELGVENLTSAEGVDAALKTIEQTIEKISDGRKVFVMVLDEFDVLLMDKRSKPSNFVYKLHLLEENLKKRNLLTCIITISNNVIADYDLDDRVRSRIGSTEIFFEPYSADDIFNILNKRVSDALVEGVIDDIVLKYCAEQSSLGHGDARRAIDLLRISAELVALGGEKKILQTHVDAALDKLQKDRVLTTLAAASYHHKVLCFAIGAYLICWMKTCIQQQEYIRSTSNLSLLAFDLLDTDEYLSC
jgi:archaeal cell division control protein 6